MQLPALKLAALAFAASLFILAACGDEETIATFDCTGDNPTYTVDVRPILNASCAISGCHDAATRADNKDFSNYNSAKNLAVQQSFLGSIQRVGGFKAMPQDRPKLSDAQIKTLSCWVQNGLPE